jgi:hypothetical protein
MQKESWKWEKDKMVTDRYRVYVQIGLEAVAVGWPRKAILFAFARIPAQL